MDVNGATAHPLFLWLQSSLSGFLTDAIKWNFTKFLVVDGVPRVRYGPRDDPLSFEDDIAAALAGSSSRASVTADAAPAADPVVDADDRARGGVAGHGSVGDADRDVVARVDRSDDL